MPSVTAAEPLVWWRLPPLTLHLVWSLLRMAAQRADSGGLPWSTIDETNLLRTDPRRTLRLRVALTLTNLGLLRRVHAPGTAPHYATLEITDAGAAVYADMVKCGGAQCIWLLCNLRAGEDQGQPWFGGGMPAPAEVPDSVPEAVVKAMEHRGIIVRGDDGRVVRADA